MPIRPENRDRYPPSWREISARIRFGRAESRCECEGECGHDHALESAWGSASGKRCEATHGHAHPETGARVVLTVAHLDFTPENCADENLKAMCQRCHNAYDAPERRRGILARFRARAAVGDLFG